MTFVLLERFLLARRDKRRDREPYVDGTGAWHDPRWPQMKESDAGFAQHDDAGEVT